MMKQLRNRFHRWIYSRSIRLFQDEPSYRYLASLELRKLEHPDKAKPEEPPVQCMERGITGMYD